jgi:hypothetical protein
LDHGRSSLGVDVLDDTVIQKRRVAVTISLQDEVAREEFLVVQMMNRVKVSRGNLRFGASVLFNNENIRVKMQLMNKLDTKMQVTWK